MYSVEYSIRAIKTFQKLDKQPTAKLLYAWIEKNLVGCSDPRIHGKALVGDKRGYWRYRVGSYRIIAEINDSEVKIYIINVAHRRNVYDK